MPKRIPREAYETLIRALQLGHSRLVACGLAGVSRSTFYAKLRADERFRQEVERAETLGVAKAEARLLEGILDGDLASARWFLERRLRSVYGPKAEAYEEDDGYTIEIITPPDGDSSCYKVELMER